MDAKSLYNLINNGQELDRKYLFFHYPHYHSSGWTPGSALRKGDWKLIHFYEDDSFELYNLKEDISEMNNLAVAHPEKVDELYKDLQQIINETNSSLPMLNK